MRGFVSSRLLHRLFQAGGSEHRDGWMRSAVQEVPSRPHVAVGRRPAKRRRLAYAPAPLQIHPMFSLPESNLQYARKTTHQVQPATAGHSGSYASRPAQGKRRPGIGLWEQRFTPAPRLNRHLASSSQAQARSGIPLAITAIASGCGTVGSRWRSFAACLMINRAATPPAWQTLSPTAW